LRTFFSTTSVHNGEKVESCTIADSLGNSVFITEGDWIEIGRMKRWVAPKNKQIKRELSEKERNEIWEGKIKPLLKRKISEVGFEQVIKDERMLDNFSKGLSISTGQLKEKISTEWGVV